MRGMGPGQRVAHQNAHAQITSSERQIKGEADKGREKRCQCAFKILAQQLVKGVRRAMPVEHLTGPIVEHHLHAFDLGT